MGGDADGSLRLICMSDRLGIIFMHHALDAVTMNNFRSIQRQNPDAYFTSIGVNEALPGGYSLRGTPELKALHEQMPQKSSDRLLCSWHLQRRPEDACDKWWIAEWDVFCNVPVRDYYRPVWDFPLVASSTRLMNREPEWHWFKEVKSEVEKAPKKLPSAYQPFLMGMVPFIFLASDATLKATCAMLLKEPIQAGNGEIRFATAANRCGYQACGFSPPNDQITWKLWSQLPANPAIVHPVKFLAET
jgi:hypothetical protein